MSTPNRFPLLKRILPLLLVFLGVLRFISYQCQYSTVGSDFVQDYAASKAFFAGEGIYGSAISKIAVTLGFSGIENFHPPFGAVLLSPFAIFDFPIAFVAFNILGFFALVAAILGSAQYFKLKQSEFLWALALLVNSYPFIASVGCAQSSSLIAAGIIGSWLFARRGSERIAGVLLAFVSLLKLYPALFIVILWLCGHRRAVTTTVITGLILGSLCLGALGFDTFTEYLSIIAPRNVAEWMVFPINLSVTSWLAGLFTAPALGQGGWSYPLVNLGSAVLPLAKVCSVIVILATIAWAGKLAQQGRKDQAACIGICGMILAAPISWQHFLTIMMFPLLLFWSQTNFKAPKKFLLISIALLCLSWPDIEVANVLMDLSSPHLMPWWWLFAVKVPVFGVLLITWLTAQQEAL